jgi:hypothetical protein
MPIERNYTFETTRAFMSKIGGMIESLIPKKVISSLYLLLREKEKFLLTLSKILQQKQ